MNFIHLKNPYRQDILSIILSLLCVRFSFGSICKYWIFNIEDTSSLNRSSKYVNARYRKLKTKTKIKTKNIQSTILGTFIKKNSPQNLTVFHCGLIELEILEIFTTGYFSKTTIWTWIFLKFCRVLLSLKRKKNLLKKMQATKKLLELARDRRKTLKKEKEKRKMRKSQTTKISFLLFYIKKFIFCLKTYLEKLILYCYICNTVFSRCRLLEMQ